MMLKAPPLRLHQQGLTLIELMVALVLGMLITLAATSGASFFESSRRSAIGNSGALENGIAVSFNIQRDVQSAGLWAVNAPCTTIYKYDPDDTTNNGWVSSGDVGSASYIGNPVILTAGSSATASDTIATNAMTQLIGAPVTLTTQASGAVMRVEVSDRTGFAVGDSILIAPPGGQTGTCYLATITHLPSDNGIQTRPSDNRIDTTQKVNQSPSAYDWEVNTQVFNLGTQRSNLYRVTNTFNSVDLDVFESVDLRADTDADINRNGSTTVLAENIMMLRAQYGISASPTSLAISKWVNPGNADATANRLRAVRIAVVARSQQPNLKDKDSSGVCTTTTASPAIPWTIGSADDTPLGLDLDLTAKASRKCYEYRVTSLVIPLKNYLFTGGGA